MAEPKERVDSQPGVQAMCGELLYQHSHAKPPALKHHPEHTSFIWARHYLGFPRSRDNLNYSCLYNCHVFLPVLGISYFLQQHSPLEELVLPSRHKPLQQWVKHMCMPI